MRQRLPLPIVFCVCLDHALKLIVCVCVSLSLPLPLSLSLSLSLSLWRRYYKSRQGTGRGAWGQFSGRGVVVPAERLVWEGERAIPMSDAELRAKAIRDAEKADLAREDATEITDDLAEVRVSACRCEARRSLQCLVRVRVRVCVRVRVRVCVCVSCRPEQRRLGPLLVTTGRTR